MNAFVLVALAWSAANGLSPAPAAPPGAQAAPADQTIVCRSIALDPVRIWTFSSRAGTWRVAHHVDGQARRASLVLPRAVVTLTADAVSVRARTANGGIDLTLLGPWARATLDAYISYELEVNVDASLTPDIDEIATESPTGVACERP